MHRALPIAVAVLALSTTAPAPAPAQPPVSALTGLTFPDGTKLEKGFLSRMAAKADLEMTANDQGTTVSGTYEIYRLGPIAGATATLPAVKALVARQGWTLSPFATDSNSGWLGKGGTKLLLAYALQKGEAWLYLAEVTARAPVVAKTPPSAPSTPSRPSQPAAAPPAAPPVAPAGTPQPVATPSGPKRFQFWRTEFDDGWVSEEQPDFVKVVRGGFTVYLFYRIPITEQMRPPVIEVVDYFWNQDGRPRFDLRTVDRRPELDDYPKPSYLEGEATERATGRRVYLGMYIHKTPAGALDILVVAPDRDTFRQAYPRPADLERLLFYNKFAVAPADLVGAWGGGSAAATQMYYTQTGNYAGMNLTTSSDQFWIEGDGSYRSRHVGTAGMVGNQSAYQQQYRGPWQVRGIWELSLGNRYNGKTEAYYMQFEVVKGGRVLHLTDKSAPALQYHLVMAR